MQEKSHRICSESEELDLRPHLEEPSKVDTTFVWFLRVMAVLMIVLVIDMTIHNIYLMSIFAR